MKIYVCLTALVLLGSVACASDLNIEAKEAYYGKKASDLELSPAERFRSYDSLLFYLDLQGKKGESLLNRYDYAQLQFDMGNYRAALVQYGQVMDGMDSTVFSDSLQTELELYCYYQMGKLAMFLGFYPQSMQYFFDLLEINDNEENYVIKTYSNLALLFQNMHQEQQSNHYLSLAGELVRSRDSVQTNTLFVFYNNLAGVFYLQKAYDSAIHALEHASRYCEGRTDKDVIEYNLANIYLDIGEIGIAKECLRNVIVRIEGAALRYVHVIALVNMAYIYGQEGFYEEALDYYDQALGLARKMGARKVEATVLLEMSSVYKKNGSYLQALELLERGMALQDSLFSIDQVENINMVSQNYIRKQERLEKDLLEQRLENLELSNQNKNKMLNVLWMCMFVLAVSFFLALYSWRKGKEERKLQRKNFQSRETTFTLDMEEKAKQLTSLNLHLIQATEIIEECRTEVKKMHYQKVLESKESLRHLEDMLSSLNVNSVWDEFELYFNQVYHSFFARLIEYCPDLTRGEKRTCALLALNLSAKEIAQITHRSPRTVEYSIYQIRKKMKIPADVRTLSFLQRFIEDSSGAAPDRRMVP